MNYLSLWSRCLILIISFLLSGLTFAQTTLNTENSPRLNFPFKLKPPSHSSCPKSALTADVVAIDHPMVFNRLGAQNVNWMMYALRHDIIDLKSGHTLDYTRHGEKLFRKAKSKRKQASRDIALRPDLRPRPLVLRVAAGDYLKVRFTNLLHVDSGPHPKNPDDHFSNQANPYDSYPDPLPGIDHPMEHAAKDPLGTLPKDKIYRLDDQVASRTVGFHPQGLELVRSINNDSSYIGENDNSLAMPGETREYCFYAPEEGAYLVSNDGAVFGGEGTSGDSGVGLFAAITVQPKGARFYRAQVTEEEMRLATIGETPSGQPIIDYEATYPKDCATNGIWCQEGKAGKPVLKMVQKNRIIHGDINALIIGPEEEEDGRFPKETYPLEASGKQNPALPNRLEPFREFVTIFHDENAATQAFPYFFEHPELKHTLHGVRDAFMINYGSGGVGAEIIANRLKVGPMQDCLDCAYEEFFLSSFAVGDAAMLVDKPANLVTSQCQPEYLTDPEYADLKREFCNADNDFEPANEAYYPHDPANVHHSYIGDFVKFRNLHSGKEQHIFHLHNHQWLFNPNDDNSNYIDAQGIGPGSGYTYEIAYGGSGNRNKTVGDAIYHCHLYPHFAQGMWYMWRNHDVFEAGTKLAVSQTKSGFHEEKFGLMHGRPADESRALPDGEIIAGTPIPAIVPLPGKGIALMPEPVHVTAKSNGLGSKAELLNPFSSETVNPGYPFWIAGVTEHSNYQSSVGSRPTTPPLDMSEISGVVSGHDGGLPRHALAGYSVGGTDEWELDRISAAKHLLTAKPIYFNEKGTDLEKIAMIFHATRNHPTHQVNMAGVFTPSVFVTNGAPPIEGAPFNEPCIDDVGELLMKDGDGKFFGGEKDRYINVVSPLLPTGIEFGADNPRVYKGANLQLDVVFNKLGYHYPQQRILTLWEDVGSLLDQTRPPEPLVMRLNTFDCAMYAHTNLVPKDFYADDYQITTPTDVIGQHIHLPKWDLTSADGGANGWNYEDGTFSPGMVRERIHAINEWNAHPPLGQVAVPNPYDGSDKKLIPKIHPYFNAELVPGHQKDNCIDLWNEVHGDSHEFDINYGMPGKCDWLGARTTLQRWFSDPLVNAGNLGEQNSEVHRGLGITFTHDHLGPSTHQQLGLYATMLTEPPGSEWRHNETGELLYNVAVREDGGPTSWQAVITGKKDEEENEYKRIDVDGDGKDDSHREFFLQFGDFQHAYQKDAYYGVNDDGVGWPLDKVNPPGSPKFAKPDAESFRLAINPSVRKPANPVFPDIIAFEPDCPGGTEGLSGAVYDPMSGRPPRPCPEAISADDIGMMVVNYRNEPIGARVYDENKIAPADGKKGDQTSGFDGDLAFALQTRTNRANKVLNGIGGEVPGDGTTKPYYASDINSHRLPGDPFTPIMRAYSGDLVRVKIQAGAHEHEHNASVNALAWMQGGSGFGQAPHSGWRNAQNAGLSEQFTFSAHITDYWSPTHLNDRMYTIDSSQDGMWNGVWGILRSKVNREIDDNLVTLPTNSVPTVLTPGQGIGSDNVCPAGAPVRSYHVAAVLANKALGNDLGITIPDAAPGSHLDPDGGTLVYNPRTTMIKIEMEDDYGKITEEYFGAGPLHDPTAILFVRMEDLDIHGKIKDGRPVEPLVLRAAAGECVQVVLHNRLPWFRNRMADLDGYTSVSGIITRDKGTPGSKMTTFNNNLIRPSNRIGLHPQLVHYNVQSYDGNNVGVNHHSTIAPGWQKIYQWYAGVVEIPSSAEACLTYEGQDIDQKYDLLSTFARQPNLRPLTELITPEAFQQIVLSTLDPKYIESGKASGTLKKVASLLKQKANNLGCFETILPIGNNTSQGQQNVSREQQKDILKVFIGLFNAIPSKGEFADLINLIEGGMTVEQFANVLATDVRFANDLMVGKVTTASQVALLMSNFGLIADNDPTSTGSQAEAFFTAQIEAGVGFGSIVYNAVNFLPENTLPKFNQAVTLLVNNTQKSGAFSSVTSSNDININALQNELGKVVSAAALTNVDIQTLVDSSTNVSSSSAYYDPIQNLDKRLQCSEGLEAPFYNILKENGFLQRDFASRIAASFAFETEGIEPGSNAKATFAWRKDRYPDLSRKTTRLAKLTEACRYVPVEFGGTTLTPPDRIKQGQKAAIGALVIEPEKSLWIENYDDRAIDRQNPGPGQSNKRKTRATATVFYPTDKNYRFFRDLVMVHQKGLNLRYADGSAVANLAAEKENLIPKNPGYPYIKDGINYKDHPDYFMNTAPEDAHDSGHMAINYGTEPMWFRFGLPPDAPFGKEGFGGAASAWQAFSNRCCSDSTPSTGGTVISADQLVGEPYVPIMTAYAGREMRIRALMPTGVGRASTVELHGHGWPRDPYLAEHVVQTSIGSFPEGSRPADWGVPSKCIGDNAMAMYLGGQESITPMAHFDLVFPRAGGKRGVKGDYLWRDHAGYGITSGLWALVRVEPFRFGFAPTTLRSNCDS